MKFDDLDCKMQIGKKEELEFIGKTQQKQE